LRQSSAARCLRYDDIMDVEQWFCGEGGIPLEAVHQSHWRFSVPGNHAQIVAALLQPCDQRLFYIGCQWGSTPHRITGIAIKQLDQRRAITRVMEIDCADDLYHVNGIGQSDCLLRSKFRHSSS
jgi:hypothetical protein